MYAGGSLLTMAGRALAVPGIRTLRETQSIQCNGLCEGPEISGLHQPHGLHSILEGGSETPG